MAIRHTVLVAALASCFAQSSIAATAELNEPTFYGDINGHTFYHADYAIWATDGGTFDLDGATVTSNWPWFGRPPVLGEDNFDLYGKSAFSVTTFSKGDVGRDYTANSTFQIDWNTGTDFALNIKNADLVIFNAAAFSDGSRAHVANAFGAGITPAVPEPETYALMLAGLGITALTARRKRQTA
ncbi:PEP-CTERM sorting domain-containing protein [Niveibacterium sp.]|uniref:PEP-CTERM sorting domain-containing protein n=1 Tax=Niveibacterium sp. TaxID=2017444 RepID=UPI0035B28CBE